MPLDVLLFLSLLLVFWNLVSGIKFASGLLDFGGLFLSLHHPLDPTFSLFWLSEAFLSEHFSPILLLPSLPVHPHLRKQLEALGGGWRHGGGGEMKAPR